MRPQPIVYRSDPEFDDLGQFMKFRLHYEGPLYSSNGDPRDGQTDRRGAHKHDLRRAFHRQLRHFWQVSCPLRQSKGGYDILNVPRPENIPGRFVDQPLFQDVLAEYHNVSGRRFVPLVCKELKLLCSLDVLLLRRDKPGGIFHSRDIDNRLKTLFDGLRMPENGVEVAQCTFEEGEDPMYVLLQNDNLISRVSVETDELLDPPDHAKDDSFCRVLITVDIRPYEAMMFTLGF